LVEIDENLMRNPLAPIEQGEALVRRKEIYEQLHPETAHGGNRKSDDAISSGNNCHLIAFANEVALKTGKSDRTVRLYVNAVKGIPHDLRKQLRNTVVGKKITELKKLGTLPEADQRVVVERIVDGAESVVDAIEAVEGQRSPEMQKIVAAKKGQTDEAAAPRGDTDSNATSAKQPEDAPAEECPASDDAPAEPNEDTESALSAEASVSGGQGLEDEQPDAVDPVAVCRDFLQELPEKTSFLYEHFDDIVGKGLDFRKAAETLQEAVKFFETAHELEAELAGQPAEPDHALSSV
jgi:hypothetical protein